MRMIGISSANPTLAVFLHAVKNTRDFTLDPEAVILSGGMSRAEGLAEELVARARKYLPMPFRPYFALKTSNLGGEAAVIGAASLFMELR